MRKVEGADRERYCILGVSQFVCPGSQTLCRAKQCYKGQGKAIKGQGRAIFFYFVSTWIQSKYAFT